MTGSSPALAVRGGRPVRTLPWPRWPRSERSTEEAVAAVLRSERWAISGPILGEPARERRFAEAFAAFHGVPYCVPTANGSAALTIALEALGVGPGKEVLVPGLTWVACGSSVARVGAIPVLVDVDPKTLCMSVAAARRAITDATAAIMLVHLYCTIADLAAFTELAERTGLPLIEDCSHAHGAVWCGRRVGTFGTVSIFSMQQGKVLASGEGGAVITSDPHLYDHLQQLRADGRRYTADRGPGRSELENAGDVQGHNYCMSEFHAAILLDRLPHLDRENALRLENATRLTERLWHLGLQPLHDPAHEGRPTFYRYCLRFDLERLGHVPIESVASALTAELGIPAQPLYDPLNCNQLYDPRRSPRRVQSPEAQEVYAPSRFSLPIASTARRELIGIPHQVLLGSALEVADIVAAVEKIISHSCELAEVDERQEVHRNER